MINLGLSREDVKKQIKQYIAQGKDNKTNEAIGVVAATNQNYVDPQYQNWPN